VKATAFVLCLVLLLIGAAQAADSLNVRLVGSCIAPGDGLGVAVDGDYAYVADGDSGLRVISVADPAHPVEVGHADTPGSAREVAVSGSYAYVVDLTAGLRVFSVADPAHPSEVGHYDPPGLTTSVAVNGNYAYVTDIDSGLWVISVADPSNPTRTGRSQLPDTAFSVAVTGHLACVADYLHGLRVVSVADPANPHEVGHNDSLGFFCVTAKGDYAYADVGGYENGLFVVSLADPTHPVKVGWCNTHDLVNSIAIENGYAYAVGYSKLYVVSVSDPAHPDTIGYYHRPFWDARSLAAAGDYIYVIGDSDLSVCQRYDAGVEETMKAELRATKCQPTLIRGVLFLDALGTRSGLSDNPVMSRAALLDAAGRKALDLHPGANDVSGLRPGVYFVRERSAANGERPEVSVRKAIIGR